jgi:penicillin-binding protein 1B
MRRRSKESKEKSRLAIPAVNGWAKGKIGLLIRLVVVVLAVATISAAVLFISSYRSYAKIVDARLAHGYLTSRAGIYAAPRVLRTGQKYSPAGLAMALRHAGYLEGDDAAEVWNGSFTIHDRAIEIRPNSSGDYPSLVRVSFDSAERISELTGDEVTLDSFELAPEPLTSDSMKTGARAQLSFKDIPPVLVHAITSIEDRRFFDHHGVDVFGIGRALLRNAGEERVGQGGSTITQQLVKNTYLTPERTLRRKFAEAMLAFTIERRLSKEDIFALYCNEVFLGQRGAIAVRGVDQAARVYFGKELKDLTISEAATVAGMIQSPTRYSPVRENEAARTRRNTVLGTMVRDGFLTIDQAAALAKESLVVANFDPAKESVAPYFIDYVNRAVERPRLAGGTRASSRQTLQDEAGKDAGESRWDPDRMPALQETAPTVTTLDLDLQQLASSAVAHQLDHLDQVYKQRGVMPQAALVALDPHTGKVLAMLGGRDYAQSQMNRATDAQRQPGSVFKPFVYAAALELGMSPLAKFKDAPQEFTYAGGRKYRPANYGGGFTMQDVPMRTGLIKSLNVVTVDVAMQTGLARVANTASDFGLPRPEAYPALALGTTEVTPLRIAAAYATFANGGQRVQPRVVNGDVPFDDNQVIAPTTAYIVTDMLKDVIREGTARAARGAVPGAAIAGKTGTSRDGWFVGYTPNLVCAVWVGFDDNQQLGLTGADAALPIWTEFMKTAVDLRPELGGASFAQPAGITIADVDTDTDELASRNCPMHELVAMLATQAPLSECFRHGFTSGIASSESDASNAIANSADRRAVKESKAKRLQESSSLVQTRVVTDKNGRKTLVNDMRLAMQ